jgi:hypothetical protein
MGAQFQKPGMKADRVAATLQHDTAQVVAQQDPGQALPVLEGMGVAAQETLQTLVEGKFEVQGPGVGKGTTWTPAVSGIPTPALKGRRLGDQEPNPGDRVNPARVVRLVLLSQAGVEDAAGRMLKAAG